MHVVSSTSNLFKIDQQQAQRQLEYLGYKSGGNVYLRFFYHSEDLRKNNDKGRKLNRLRWQEAEAYQRDGRGVYVVVNGSGGGHEDKDIKKCVAIFCEWDDRPVNEQLTRWRTVNFLEPTFTIFSGDKSAQPYWVFEQSISVSQWWELQLLLIEVMGADPANKNPSRVFRLAGGWHVRPGREPTQSEIVQDSGIKYSYVELYECLLKIKASQQETEVQVDILQKLTKGRVGDVLEAREYLCYQDIDIPVSQSVPLKLCLNQDSRTLIQAGASKGARSNNGYKVAADLIGAANYLQNIGQRFDDDPLQLFLDYCTRCPSGDGWSEDEWRNIWKSAEKNHPSPSCKADGVNTCIRSWFWKNHVKPNQGHRSSIGAQHSSTPNLASDIIYLPEFQSPSPSSYEKTMEQITQILTIEDEARQKWELQLLAKATRAFTASHLLSIYQQRKQNQTGFNPIDIHDFLAQGSAEREWLIAARISIGTTLVLFADGGIGKTLLSYDLCKAIATGHPWNGYRTCQGKVLIIQTDEPEIDTRERLNIAGFAQAVPYGVLQIETNWQFSQIRKLREWIEQKQPVFVLIDSLTSANRTAEEHEKDTSYASRLYELRDIANEYHCSIMVLHHENKLGGARGTTAIRNNVSEVWRLRKGDPKDGLTPTQRVLEIEKSRSGCAGAYKVELNVEDYSWQDHGDFGTDTSTTGLPLSAQLLNYLEERRGVKFEPGELIYEFPSATKDAIYKHLERHRKKGLIESEFRVKQRETGPVRYKVFFASIFDAQVTAGNTETPTRRKPDNPDNKSRQPRQASGLNSIDSGSNSDKF